MRTLLSLIIRLAPLFLLTGAAYPLSMDTFLSVDHGTDYARVKADPAAYKGITLLLGGEIETVSAAGNQAELTVRCYRLGPRDRPLEPDPLCGRFVVVTAASADEGLLAPGRLVTLAGTVAGEAVAGGQKVPRLRAVEIHPWLSADEERRRWHKSHPYWYHDPWCDPFYYPRYRRWPYGYPYPGYCW